MITYQILAIIVFGFTVINAGDNIPFFISKNTVWTPIGNTNRDHLSEASVTEFKEIYKTDKPGYILMWIDYVFQRKPEQETTNILLDKKLPQCTPRYYIIALGKDMLWSVPCRYVKVNCGVVTLLATGKKENHFEQNAIFVPDEPKIHVKFHTEFNGSVLKFETEELDTVHLKIVDR